MNKNDNKVLNNKVINNKVLENHSYSDTSIQPSATQRHFVLRWLFFILGFLFLALGIIGIVLPVMPTTPFVLLAAACFAKSSERFYQWLVHHRYFGKYIKDWEQRRAIPKKAKFLAWTMMTISCLGLFLTFPPERMWAAWITAGICFATALWMARLPNA